MTIKTENKCLVSMRWTKQKYNKHKKIRINKNNHSNNPWFI